MYKDCYETQELFCRPIQGSIHYLTTMDLEIATPLFKNLILFSQLCNYFYPVSFLLLSYFVFEKMASEPVFFCQPFTHLYYMYPLKYLPPMKKF